MAQDHPATPNFDSNRFNNALNNSFGRFAPKNRESLGIESELHNLSCNPNMPRNMFCLIAGISRKTRRSRIVPFPDKIPNFRDFLA